MKVLLRNVSNRTLSIDITITPGMGPGARYIRASLTPQQVIDIGDAIELDELNRNADIRALRNSGLVTITTIREPGDAVDSIVPQVGDTDGSGIVHVYCSLAGNDTTGTGESTAPYRTLQLAVDRVIEWLLYGSTGDIVLHAGAGTFAEALTFSVPRLAHRVVIEGDRAGMTVLASGTTTAASTTLITDAGASFGVAQELSCYPAAVWDPADEAGTKQWTTVRWHNGTAWEPAIPFLGGSPMVGWRYAVYRPVTRVAPASDLHPALRLNLPTSFNAFSGAALGVGGAGVIFRWIEFERDAPISNPYEPVVLVAGGPAQFQGCVVRGAALGMNIAAGDVAMSGVYSWEEADPLFGLPAPFNFNEYGCGCGFIVNAGGYMGVYSQQSTLAATFVIRSTTHGCWVEGGFAQVGGAIHNGDINASWGAVVRIYPLYTHPMRISDDHQGCITADSDGIVEVFSAILESVSRSGIQSFNNAIINIFDLVTVGPGGIGRWGIDCRDGGRVNISEETMASPFSGTLGGIAVDGNDHTWADVLARSPLVGSRSGATVSHAVDVEETPPYAEFPVDANGIHRIYVNGATGSDLNDGTSTRPVATVQHACSRVEAFLRAGPPDRDIVVHIANGHYTGLTDFRPPVPPRRRVVFMGDDTAMTVTESGTVTAGSTYTLQDNTQAWTVNQWAGQWCRVKTAGGTELALVQIRSNTADTLTYTSELSFPTVAAMTYDVVVPAVLIDGFRAVLPWVGSNGGGQFTSIDSRQPQLDLAYIQFGPWPGTFPNPDYVFYGLEIKGGATLMTACRVRHGTPARMIIEAGQLSFGGQAPVVDDPVYGITGNDWDARYYAGVWLDKVSVFTSSMRPGSGVFATSVVAHDGGFYMYNGFFEWLGGGALYGASSVVAQDSASSLFVFQPYDPPILVSGITGTYAFRSKAHASVGIDGVELVGPFTAYALLCDQNAHLAFRNVTATGDIPIGVGCTRGSLVVLGPTAGFGVGTGIELFIDGDSSNDFADVVVGTPATYNGSTVIRDTQ